MALARPIGQHGSHKPKNILTYYNIIRKCKLLSNFKRLCCVLLRLYYIYQHWTKVYSQEMLLYNIQSKNCNVKYDNKNQKGFDIIYKTMTNIPIKHQGKLTCPYQPIQMTISLNIFKLYKTNQSFHHYIL